MSADGSHPDGAERGIGDVKACVEGVENDLRKLDEGPHARLARRTCRPIAQWGVRLSRAIRASRRGGRGEEVGARR